ncbi:hypothetical protein Droror1_Dr00027974 [Drosera rotundifolia]
MLGWLTMYVSDDPKSEFTKVSVRMQLLKKIGKLIEEYKHEKLSIIFTGHSLEASLSVISAFDVAENLTSEILVSAFVFGCPKVGNKQFNDRLKSHQNLKILHIRNIVAQTPTTSLSSSFLSLPRLANNPATRASPQPTASALIQTLIYRLANANLGPSTSTSVAKSDVEFNNGEVMWSSIMVILDVEAGTIPKLLCGLLLEDMCRPLF